MKPTGDPGPLILPPEPKADPTRAALQARRCELRRELEARTAAERELAQLDEQLAELTARETVGRRLRALELGEELLAAVRGRQPAELAALAGYAVASAFRAAAEASPAIVGHVEATTRFAATLPSRPERGPRPRLAISGPSPWWGLSEVAAGRVTGAAADEVLAEWPGPSPILARIGLAEKEG